MEKTQIEHMAQLTEDNIPSWFVAFDGKADGPHSIRDLDVKFRTGELASNAHFWCEGMSEW